MLSCSINHHVFLLSVDLSLNLPHFHSVWNLPTLLCTPYRFLGPHCLARTNIPQRILFSAGHIAKIVGAVLLHQSRAPNGHDTFSGHVTICGRTGSVLLSYSMRTGVVSCRTVSYCVVLCRTDSSSVALRRTASCGKLTTSYYIPPLSYYCLVDSYQCRSYSQCILPNSSGSLTGVLLQSYVSLTLVVISIVFNVDLSSCSRTYSSYSRPHSSTGRIHRPSTNVVRLLQEHCKMCKNLVR